MPHSGTQLGIAFEAVDQMRRDLGRQLHDTLCQSLTGLNMMVQVLANRARQGMPVADSLEELGGTVNGIMDEARSLLRQLQPVMPEERGLMDAMANLAATTNARTHCVFDCEAPVLISDPNVALSLYRIAEEAVRNSVEQEAGRRITLSLSSEAGEIALEIWDDGSDWASKDEILRGIDAMQMRAAAIGATLAISSAMGVPTIRCTVRQNCCR